MTVGGLIGASRGELVDDFLRRQFGDDVHGLAVLSRNAGVFGLPFRIDAATSA
jgi:hypothetical protein